MKNNSFLSSEEIVKSFLSYLDDSIYSYAYLLDGSWGSGKTFFVKEILIPSIVKHEKEKKDQDSEYKEKRILYVSLYGIKETEEISRLLYLELRKVMADKMTTGRFLKKHTPQIPTWLGTTSKIVSDVIKDSKGIDIENIINKISTGFSLKNCIFIFDDLERTSCNVNDILGYINNFIEHDQVKVLLIANEAEINTASRLDADPEELLVCLQDNLDFGFLESEENSGYNGSQSTTRSEKQKISLQKLMKRVEVVFARNQAYKQIKEKVVGETVKYQPEYLKMITNLIERNLNNDEKLREILLNKANKIEEIAEYYEHFNLRTFLFFLSKVVTLYDCLQQHVETFEKMIDYIFLISVKYKTGKEIEQWEEPKLFELRLLYGWFDFRNQCLAFKFVDEFVLYGKLNSREIVETVTLYEEFEQKNAESENDPARQIQSWGSMDEKTVKVLMEEIILKMGEDKYSFATYLNILHNFVALVSIGFDEAFLNQLVEYMKNNIRNASERIELQGGYSFFINEDDKKLYALKSRELNVEIEEKNNSYQEKEMEKMLEDVNSWGINVNKYVTEHRKVVPKSFISKMDPGRILTLIEQSNTENIEAFRYAINDLYSFSNISDFYMEDYENLKTIYEGIKPDDQQYDLIKKKNVELLKVIIGRKMELLRPKSIDGN